MVGGSAKGRRKIGVYREQGIFLSVLYPMRDSSGESCERFRSEYRECGEKSVSREKEDVME
ncbi:hypothetical protein COLO4_08246 [Corchorus olitorius]|uniref:Uncharacterized protein n=1 Tax=Corchorus olitorius TaxID=93759 RepID=A0A1R3KGQ6_9ROSI|nr:hypothetical protein COLO4_08246 [Corchorus olitorius]